MDPKDLQPGTRALSRTAMVEFVERGWKPGQRVGCTFCHRPSLSSRIPDALSHFSGRDKGGSRHPVARNFSTGHVDNSHYFSSDNSVTPDHLDCCDCHDASLVSIPNHDPSWLKGMNPSPASNRTTNPFALRGVSAPKAYDDLCRNCHGGAESFRSFTGKDGSSAQKLTLVSHDNGVDLAGNAIRDRDNTLLRTSTQPIVEGKRQCTACHDAHRSRNEHLFSDGHEKDNTGLAETPIDEVRGCTTVCHFRGDRFGNYDIHGHGAKTNWAGISLARDCTFCHDAGKPHNTRSEDYVERNRLPKLDSTWLLPSAFGNPQKSVCSSCHGKKTLHLTKKGVVGCLDCHDPHGKGSDNNVMMIPNTNIVAGSRIGIKGVGAAPRTEVVYFWKSPKYPRGDNVFHFFTDEPYGASRTTSAGFCDQRACHGLGSKDGSFYIPLKDYMSSGKHSGGVIPPNSNCESCHVHDNEGGSFGATGRSASQGGGTAGGYLCTFCHGQPPPPADNTAGNGYPFDETLTPHILHATTYRIDCRTCHKRYTELATHNTKSRSYQDVYFADNAARGDARYDSSALSCSGIACHTDGRGGEPYMTPRWILSPAPGTRFRLYCDGCHGGSPLSSPARPLATGGHRRHLGKNVKCHSCHSRTAAADCNAMIDSSTGYSAHVNGTVEVSFPPGSGGSFNEMTKDCSGVSCHSGNAVNWLAGIGPDVGQYFDRSIQKAGPANYDDNSSHPLAGLTDGTFGRYVFPYPNDNVRSNCLECHYASGPSRTSDECLKCHFEGGTDTGSLNHGNGILEMARISSDTTAPTTRFPISTLAEFDDWCLQCHDKGAISLGGRKPSESRGTLIDAYSWGNSRHRTLRSRAPGCITCHSAHGEGNSQLVRHNPPNRVGAGPAPAQYGLFPSETLDSFPPGYNRYGPQFSRHFARIDNTATDDAHSVFADAEDQNVYCSLACHNMSYPKDRMIVRDNTTGNYLLTDGNLKQYAVAGFIYKGKPTGSYLHIHVSYEIIPTDDMVRWYASRAGISGPGFYHYPDKTSSDPSVADSAWNADKRSPLPFFPDFPDGDRDFKTGYLNRGRISYRFTCSTCHNPHGTSEANSRTGDMGYPDLRVTRANSAICVRCHS